MSAIQLFTIGFTKKSAEEFFGKLIAAKVKRVLDVRLNNVSQLAGFSKRDDLAYFLRVIGAIDYQHVPLLAPTQEMLDAYKKHKGEWKEYEKRFTDLIRNRAIELQFDRSLFHQGCLLCSEDTPDQCHRRVVAEYLQAHWGDLEIVHLS